MVGPESMSVGWGELGNLVKFQPLDGRTSIFIAKEEAVVKSAYISHGAPPGFSGEDGFSDPNRLGPESVGDRHSETVAEAAEHHLVLSGRRWMLSSWHPWRVVDDAETLVVTDISVNKNCILGDLVGTRLRRLVLCPDGDLCDLTAELENGWTVEIFAQSPTNPWKLDIR